MSLAPLPPYALAAPTFPFKHLVGLAGRAPIGGAREVALACFVTARLVADHAAALTDGEHSRTARSAGAKAWLGTLALPAAVRTSAGRCAECAAGGSREEVSSALAGLTTAASTYLDAGSRAELEALSAALLR